MNCLPAASKVTMAVPVASVMTSPPPMIRTPAAGVDWPLESYSRTVTSVGEPAFTTLSPIERSSSLPVFAPVAVSMKYQSTCSWEPLIGN